MVGSWLIPADQMDLTTLPDIDPETGHTGYGRATGIGFETEHILVELLHGVELRRLGVDADGMMVDFENADAHKTLPPGADTIAVFFIASPRLPLDSV
jgi:hypothetical protein